MKRQKDCFRSINWRKVTIIACIVILIGSSFNFVQNESVVSADNTKDSWAVGANPVRGSIATSIIGS